MTRSGLKTLLIGAMVLTAALLPGSSARAQDPDSPRDEDRLQERLGVYQSVDLLADLSALGKQDRAALRKLIEAAEVIDDLYWKQMGRQALEARAAFRNPVDPLDRLIARYVAINYGPFDIRNGLSRFVVVNEDDRPRLPGAGFYPEDLTKDEFDRFVTRHPHLREEFERANTLIRRVDDALIAVPFEKIYLEELETAAEALKQSAALVRSPSLRRYLSLRSEALTSGDYFRSDMAWLDVKGNLIDVVIGPIETQDDALLGLKASYEAAIVVKDLGETKMLDLYTEHLNGMSSVLPVDVRYRTEKVPAGNVLEVVNVVRFAGDFNAGIKTIAASLPNDERVIREKGAKKQIYKNVLEAKFDAILEPMARLFLSKRAQKRVTREAFVTNILMHELAHTLGVDYVAGDPNRTVRQALGDLYSPIDEAKADVIGIFNLIYLKREEILTDSEVEECYATYLAGLLRSVRFGAEEPHARATAVQLNYLMREKGIRFDEKKGTFDINERRFEATMTSLAGELLEIMGTGDHGRARDLLATHGSLGATLIQTLERSESVPVDVTFNFPM